MRAQTTALRYLDSGNALFASDTLPADKAQRARQLAQARLIADALAAMKPDALNVGRTDLTGGVELLRELQRRYALPLVSANVRLADGSELFAPTRVIEWDGARLGVFGLTHPLERLDRKLGILVTDPITAAREAVESLGEMDFVVCLSDLGYDVEHQLAQEVGGIHAIVGGGKGQRVMRMPLRIGDTILLRAADRGRFIGTLEVRRKDLGDNWSMPMDAMRLDQMKRQLRSLRVRIEQTEAGPERDALDRTAKVLARQGTDDAGVRYRHQIISLSREIPDDPVAAAKVAKFLEKYPPPQKRASSKTSSSKLLTSPPSKSVAVKKGAPPRPGSQKPWAPVEGPPRHIGSTVCRQCHPDAYRGWISTGHFRARSRLPVAQQADPSCLPCHSTRLEMVNTVSVEPTVACETCHGQGSAHRDAADMRLKPPRKICANCHKGYHERVEAFDYGKAYEKIRCDREGVKP